jgi:hypothetical protein
MTHEESLPSDNENWPAWHGTMPSSAPDMKDCVGNIVRRLPMRERLANQCLNLKWQSANDDCFPNESNPADNGELPGDAY